MLKSSTLFLRFACGNCWPIFAVIIHDMHYKIIRKKIVSHYYYITVVYEYVCMYTI